MTMQQNSQRFAATFRACACGAFSPAQSADNARFLNGYALAAYLFLFVCLFAVRLVVLGVVLLSLALLALLIMGWQPIVRKRTPA